MDNIEFDYYWFEHQIEVKATNNFNKVGCIVDLYEFDNYQPGSKPEWNYSCFE
jgi:hypothetical protein